MTESKYDDNLNSYHYKDKDNNNHTQLSNDPIFVNDEIERIHRKIYHLRRTNNEIRKFYLDDQDCVQALDENIIVIEKNLNSLFIYFKLYKSLTNKEHFYTKLYEKDLKMQEKLDQHGTYNDDNKTHQDPIKHPRKLKEFDLDYVAQRLRDKTKELEAQKENDKKKQNDVQKKEKTKKNDSNNNNNDDDDFIADDEGGFTL